MENKRKVKCRKMKVREGIYKKFMDGEALRVVKRLQLPTFDCIKSGERTKQLRWPHWYPRKILGKWLPDGATVWR
jgi:hypothetical protein